VSTSSSVGFPFPILTLGFVIVRLLMAQGKKR
jgi:hypothetical protein